MILCLDIGNSHIFGGVFDGENLRLTFRKASRTGASSDEHGLFFRSVLRENGIDPDAIERIAMCSVVPEVVYAISASCRKYFDLAPFILQAGVRTGLKIGYQNPKEVGTDRIANAIAGAHLLPGQDFLIIDLGTATTLCAVSRGRTYMGGVILSGLRLSMLALESGASKLGAVEIVRSERALGRTTSESIQSGLFLGHLGALREIIDRVVEEEYGGQRPRVLATGGFASLFEDQNLFDINVPDLVLQGLKLAEAMNRD
ncbi:type III pantothenate kinase [Elongatibacter sediminis]|uniref:Type III pantothenate kinase n=1 Tax=Elongatibacter sediminis TaxID=3119006 RepID=A0AAW9RGQ2_9GAMM